MQLDFEEIEEPLEMNYVEHAKNIPLKTETKKPKISYDDILGSLNLKVNNGKLEYLQPSAAQSPHSSLKTCYRKQQQQQQPIQQQQQGQHSYIYNKYFKDYKDPIQESLEPVYLSPQEYKKQVILEIIRRNQERKRINQIKSKKLLFAQNNPTAPVYAAPTNNLNKLFRLSR